MPGWAAGTDPRELVPQPACVELRCCGPHRDTTGSPGLCLKHGGKERDVDKEEHFGLLRESAAEVRELQDHLQKIRKQEAELQADRVATLDKLKAARKARFARITAAIDDRVPKAQVARELSMDRTNLYKLLEGKEDVAGAASE